MTNAKLEPELAKAMRTELVARMILFSPDDDYKQGRGIFQDIIEDQHNGK